MGSSFYFVVYLIGILIGGTFLLAALYIYTKKKTSDSVPNSIVYAGVVLLSLSILSSIKMGDFELHARQINDVQVSNQKLINELQIKLKALEARLPDKIPVRAAAKPGPEKVETKGKTAETSSQKKVEAQAKKAGKAGREKTETKAAAVEKQEPYRDIFVRILYKNPDSPYEEIKEKLVKKSFNAVIVPTDYRELGLARILQYVTPIRIKYKPPQKSAAEEISKIVEESTGMVPRLEATTSKAAGIGDIDIWLR